MLNVKPVAHTRCWALGRRSTAIMGRTNTSSLADPIGLGGGGGRRGEENGGSEISWV